AAMSKPPMDLKPVLIRNATHADIPGILRCLGAAFKEYQSRYTAGAFEDTVLTPESIRRRMEEMTVLVALDGREGVAGTIAWQVLAEEGQLRGMAVLPELRGAGLAQRLLEAAEIRLRKGGSKRITLDTTEPLERAMRFYERNGYRRSGRE